MAGHPNKINEVGKDVKFKSSNQFTVCKGCLT